MIHTDPHLDIETLSAYADGELDSSVVARAERHLSACSACREQLRLVRELVRAAGALPRALDPPAEMWSALRHRMSGRARAPAWRFRTYGPWLAAAAVVVLAGTTLLTAGRSQKVKAQRVSPEAPPVVLVSVEQSYAGTLSELRRTLETQRGTLSPSTIRVVERSLAVIDSAIAEARAALASDPANSALVEILSAQYERKVDLLQQATKLSPSL